MKITTVKIVQELKKNYGWVMYEDEQFAKDLINDILKIINQKLKEKKDESIK